MKGQHVNDTSELNAVARRFIESQPHSEFQSMLGYRATVVGPGFAELSLVVRAQHLNRTERVHGGVLMALLDSVGGYAGVVVADESEPRRAVSLTVSTNFVRSALVGTLIARAHLTGGGRRIFFSRMEIFQNEDRIATGEGSYRYL